MVAESHQRVRSRVIQRTALLQVRPQQDVRLFRVQPVRACHPDVHRSAENVDQVVEPNVSFPDAGHVHGDHHVCTPAPRDVHRGVVQQSAVHQNRVAPLHRGKEKGDGHARQQPFGEIAAIEHHQLTPFQIGHHDPDRDHEAVERAAERGIHRAEVAKQHLVHALGREQAGRHPRLKPVQA